MQYFDRQGNEITVERFHALMLDLTYSQVGSDHVGGQHIVTLWCGMHVPMFERPSPGMPDQIFATTLTTRDDVNGVTTIYPGDTYATEAEALAGHGRYVSEARQRVAGSTTGAVS